MTSKKDGFSLTELILAAALFALISLLAGGVYIGQTRLFKTQNTEVELNQDARLILDEITNQVRQSQAVSQTCPGCSETSGPNVLILKIPSIDQSGALIANTFDYILYKKDASDPKKLIKKTIPDSLSSRPAAEKILSTVVAEINFTYDNADFTLVKSVSIDVRTQKIVGGATKFVNLSSRAILRNY